MGIYCTSKFALEAVAETLRYELSQSSVASAIVEPSAYSTAIFGTVVETVYRNRAVHYGALAEVPGKVRDPLASPDNDPQEADRVSQLIETPPGARPIRTLVGALAEQLQPLNDVELQLQTATMQQSGLSELMSLRP